MCSGQAPAKKRASAKAVAHTSSKGGTPCSCDRRRTKAAPSRQAWRYGSSDHVEIQASLVSVQKCPHLRVHPEEIDPPDPQDLEDQVL